MKSGMMRTALRGKNAWWLYFAVLFITFLATQAGALPLMYLITYFSQSDPEVAAALAKSATNFGALPIPSYQMLLLIMVPFVLGFFTLLAFAWIIQKKPWQAIISPSGRFDTGRFFFAMLTWGAIGMALELVVLAIGFEHYTFQFLWKEWAILALVAVMTVPLQAGFEELIFRGYLMQGAALAFRSPAIALVLTSVSFGVMHGINPEVEAFGSALTMPFYIGMGLLLGLVTLLDKGLELAMGAHTVNNLMGVLVISSPESAIRTPALMINNKVDPAMGLVLWFVAAALFLFIIHKKYGLRPLKSLLVSPYAVEP